MAYSTIPPLWKDGHGFLGENCNYWFDRIVALVWRPCLHPHHQAGRSVNKTLKQYIITATFQLKCLRNFIGLVLCSDSRSGQIIMNFILVNITSIVSLNTRDAVETETPNRYAKSWSCQFKRSLINIGIKAWKGDTARRLKRCGSRYWTKVVIRYRPQISRYKS